MTPYEILGIHPSATLGEAKAAYKRLAQVYHPDRPGGDAQKFQELARAFKNFRRTLPCPDCSGKGFVETKSGLAVKREKCPLCWGKP